MPFDGTVRDLTVPSLANLAYLLRHREAWPEGFKWDYSQFSSCAVGMVEKLWPEIRAHDFVPRDIARRVGGLHAFMPSHEWIAKASKVQPEHVADAIDRLLDSLPLMEARR